MSTGTAPTLMFHLAAVQMQDRRRDASARADRIAARRGARQTAKS